jgi:SulP family sulfate permease
MLSLPIPTIDLGLSGGNIFSSKIFSFAIWDHSFASYEALKTALIWSLQLAFVMSLDTLMTSVVMDQKTGHTTAKNQELLCQSISTSCMAFIGGIPGAQATVRSVLIFKEGAHSRWSSFFLGIFVLLQLFFFRDLIELVPTAVFIGIVLKIAYDIADWTPIRLYVNEIFSRHSPLLKKFTARHDEIKIYVTNREIAIIILTAGLTVVSNLFIAVATMTSLYYLGNKYFWPNNPIRDLQPQTETEGFIDED